MNWFGLVEDISDGKSVDWNKILPLVPLSERWMFDQLRVIYEIREISRLAQTGTFLPEVVAVAKDKP
jgi:hypothetical protein